MAINNHTTASSTQVVRTDTPQPTAQQQTNSDAQPPRLHAVEPRATALTQSTVAASGASASPVTVSQAPQLQPGPPPIHPAHNSAPPPAMVTAMPSSACWQATGRT